MRPPDALLLIAPGCPHCPINLAALAELVKEGAIGALEVVNIAHHPERAVALGVRSVPWTRIGDLVLEGARTPGELRNWAARAGTPEGLAAYFADLLESGRMHRVTEMTRADPERLHALVDLVRDPETITHVRVGIAAVLEELRGSGLAERLVPDLGELTRKGDSRSRQDALHFLELVGDRRALPWVQVCLTDPDPQVREAAAEAAAGLGVPA
jgi:hypothetical protein